MATMYQYRGCWTVQYSIAGKRYSRRFNKGAPMSVIKNFKTDIEKKIDRWKSDPDSYLPPIPEAGINLRMTLEQFFNKVMEKREADNFSRWTLKRNRKSFELFMQVVGEYTPIANISDNELDNFKRERKKQIERFYQKIEKPIDNIRITKGINKDLTNIKALFNYGVEKKIITKDQNPTINKIKIDSHQEPDYYTDDELDKISEHLGGDFLLAFEILLYTGARRQEAVRQRLDDDRGIKWKDINWMENKLTLYGKGRRGRGGVIRTIPMADQLRNALLEKFQRTSPKPEDFVIDFIGDTITAKFAEARKKAGVKKAGAVHVLRHTFCTTLAKNGVPIHVIMRLAGHRQLETSKIYVHLADGMKEDAIEKAFNKSALKSANREAK
jgi:integrase